jgi:acyl carrier protein phosphodiesterase
MNFLAHFQLAWPDEALIAGGLEGDFCKGPLHGRLHPAIERGVRLHRAIDAYTDAHPGIAALREHFPAPIRRYAGILVDISFDHFLTRHWSSFNEVSLGHFNTGVYRVLANWNGRLAPASQAMAARLIDHDILNRYHDWHAVPASAERVGQRLRRGNPLVGVQRHLDPLVPLLEQAFLDFYPDLAGFSARQRSGISALETCQAGGKLLG